MVKVVDDTEKERKRKATLERIAGFAQELFLQKVSPDNNCDAVFVRDENSNACVIYSLNSNQVRIFNRGYKARAIDFANEIEGIVKDTIGEVKVVLDYS